MKRQIWVDVLKGFGIIAVVLGHITYNQLLVRTIFMFHMPLFFLVGGWLHNADMPQRDYLKMKARSLLVPYLSFLVILWPLELMVSFPDQPWTATWMLTDLMVPMLAGGQLLTGFAAVFWFVTCYFLTQQLMHFLLRRWSMTRCAQICGAMLVCAYLNAWLWPRVWLPWSANAVLIAAPMYFIGYWARSRNVFADVNRFALYFVFVALAAAALNVVGIHNYVDLKYGDYGLPVLTLLSALACVGVLAVISLRLQSHLVGRGLAVVGGASMTIMFLHQFVQLMMAKKFGISQVLPRVVAALVVCLLIHELLKMSPFIGRFFLGLQTAKTPFELKNAK